MDSMQKGQCPKCSSTQVYRNREQRGDRGNIPISSMRSIYLTMYLCLDCGHFAEYVNPEDIRNEEVRKKLMTSWSRVS